MAKKELEIQVRLRDLISKQLTIIQQKFHSFANAVKSAFRGVTSLIFNLKTALIGLATTGFVASFITAASSMETFRMQLQAVIGDQQRANAVFMELRDYAAKSPVGTEDLIEGYIMLRRIGVENLDVVIKKISEVALVSNRTVTETAQAFVSLESETLRRLGIEIERTADKAVLSSGEGAKKITVQVKNTASDIRKALIQIWDKQLPDAMALASDTFKGKMEGLKGSIQLLMADIGELYLPKIKQFVENLDKFIQKHHDDILAFFVALPEIWDIALNKINAKITQVKADLMAKLNPMKWFENWALDLPILIPGATVTIRQLINAKQESNKSTQQEKSLLEQTLELINKHKSALIEKNKENQKVLDSIKQEEQILKKISESNEKLAEAYKPKFSYEVDAKVDKKFSKKMTELDWFGEGFKVELRESIKEFQDWAKQGQMAAHNLAYGIKDSMANAFTDLITRTKTAKEVMVDFGNSVLNVFARIASEIAAQQAIGFLFGDISRFMPKASGTGLFGKLFGAESGGIFSGGWKPVPFASGGVVNQPTLGLVGEGRYNEAVVPLPDGRRIPVEMRNGGSGVNVIINMVVQAWDASDIMRNRKTLAEAMAQEIKSNGSIRGALKQYV